VNRVHFLGTECDLCDLKGVYDTAARIRGVGLGSPAEAYDGTGLQGVRIPRLDVLIMNAGISGYLGFNYPLATKDILTNLKQSVTWPNFLNQNTGVTAKPQRLIKPANGHTVISSDDASEPLINGNGNAARKTAEDGEPVLGEVFLANVFGHYLLAHHLMPLLSNTIDRPAGDKSRVIWLGSLDALDEKFSIEDIQGLTSSDAYKSSKRLTDLLALSSDLPAVRKVSASWFHPQSITANGATGEGSGGESTPRKSKRIAVAANGNGNVSVQTQEMQRPELYVAHPGICVTDIVSTNWIQSLLWTLSLYIARWLGSVWHPVIPEKGACAPVWAALVEQEVLDSMEGTVGSLSTGDTGIGYKDSEGFVGNGKTYGARKGKWGTCTNWWGEERVRRTEVEGWGWDGAVREVVVGEEKKGRKYKAVAVTKESREEFEVEAVQAWKFMEELRVEWEERLELGRK
jgi:3-keto steroid reductase